MSKFKSVGKLVVVLAIAAGGVYAWRMFGVNRTITELLTENSELKQAIGNLSHENQIGYAKVISQERREGKLFTRLLFVETDPKDTLKRIVEKEYEIEGDIVHFDALVVKFDSRFVMDGKERALYLWRRVYGEKMRPEEGFAIEEEGVESARYQRLCERLSVRDKELFWSEIWALGNDTGRLEELGVRAIHGNVVYKKLEPGLIYVFKISSTGDLYPETVPDL